VTVGKVEAVEL